MNLDPAFAVIVKERNCPDDTEQLFPQIRALWSLPACSVLKSQLDTGQGLSRIFVVDEYVDALNLT